MLELDRVSSLFWRSMRMRPSPPEAGEAFVAKGGLSVEARLEIYRTAYWVRQVRALRETFPLLASQLGEGPFARWASRYLQANPSQSWALERLGRRLPEFLRSEGQPLWAEWAALEWARTEALVAPSEPVAQVRDLRPEQIHCTWLSVRQAVTFLTLSDEAKRVFPGAPSALPVLAIWRQDFSLYQRWVSHEEAQVAQAAKEPMPLPELCERLAGSAGSAAAAFHSLQAWFARSWVGRMSSSALLLTAIVSLLGCGTQTQPPPCEVPNSAGLAVGEVTGPLMRPGSNCLRCHSSNGLASTKPFSVGGTIFPSLDSAACEGVEGVTVRVKDVKGKTVELMSNAAGNFFSAEPLTPPLQMEAERDGRRLVMPVTAPTGGCALCHSYPDPVSASGRIRGP